MSINLAALEKALSAVELVGKGEHSFEIQGTSMTLRVLLPEEEVEVQKYAQAVLTQAEDEEQHTAMSFLDRFKTAIISYSLIQIGDMDLRAETYIETGEKLSNGKMVKLPKAEALQGIVKKWARHLMVGVFRKYAELLAQVEKDAEDAIVFEPVDIEAEILRLEERVAELREAQEEDTTSPFSSRIQKMATMDGEDTSARQENISKMEQAQAQAAPPPEPEEAEAEEEFIPFTPEAEPAPRQSAIPQQAAPPQPAAQPRPPQDVQDGPVDLLPQVQESFVDAGDMDSMASAVAAENRRLAKRRAQSGLPMHNVQNPDGSALTAAHQQGLGRRTPPHLAARKVSRGPALDAPVEVIPEAHQQVGEIGGTPVFRQGGPEMIGTPRQPAPGQPKAAINPSQSGTVNPRFRGKV